MMLIRKKFRYTPLLDYENEVISSSNTFINKCLKRVPSFGKWCTFYNWTWFPNFDPTTMLVTMILIWVWVSYSESFVNLPKCGTFGQNYSHVENFKYTQVLYYESTTFMCKICHLWGNLWFGVMCERNKKTYIES